MAKSRHFYIRRTHRYLGILLGIQFLFWTIGGLYFSWTNIDEVHGDFEKKKAPLIAANIPMISPAAAIDSLRSSQKIDSIISLQLIEILGKPHYQLRSVNASATHAEGHDHEPPASIFLVDAASGQLRPPLTEQESIELAKRRFNGTPAVKSVEYLQNTNGHHEYRESPLPAYAIHFDHPASVTVYVSTELGTVQKFRNNKWRVFDFLWMLHTMDYQSRDDFGNILLRAFSIFGLLTVVSGFLLYGISSKRFKKKKPAYEARQSKP